MLNISSNKLNKTVEINSFSSSQKVFFRKHYKHFNRFLIIFSAIIFITLFLPWTQNVSGNGNVTTLRPDQRPQNIQSPIPGRIEKWYVDEGDFVKKGDTILHISEIKNEYFDPNLIQRTQKQIDAKSNSLDSYQNKVNALKTQVAALKNEQKLKLEQVQNKLLQSYLKVTSDSINYEAAKTNLSIAKRQYNRAKTLQEEGIKSLKDVEEKKLKLQETQAKLISNENKLLASKNEVINAKIELNRTQANYTDKIAKAESNLFTAQSNMFDTEAQVTKLENSYSNYSKRSDLYFIKASQDGFINRALRGGIGQTFKEGESLVGIMPSNIDMAVETYIDPIDLPLIHINESVQIQFDGWPSIVFSGWPNASYGTFTGKVVAIESFISKNGKYRILIAPDKDTPEWPKALRAGTGAKTIALLDDVPVWFEIWRNLNGFPPNYYQPTNVEKKSKK